MLQGIRHQASHSPRLGEKLNSHGFGTKSASNLPEDNFFNQQREIPK
jgi:hypothetical protein